MGYLNITESELFSAYIESPVPNARLYVYRTGTETLCPIYEDSGLTTMRANPVTASPAGTFDVVYVMEGDYRILITNPGGKTPVDRDGLQIGSVTDQGIIKWYRTVYELLNNTSMTYVPGGGSRAAKEHDLLQVGEGNHLYKVAAATATDHHLTTAGGVKLYVLPVHGHNVRAFGALGDGVTNDQPALVAAINACANDVVNRLYFPSGTYHCAEHLYFCHSATYNPNFPSNALFGGRIVIEGDGFMSRRDYSNDTYSGSIISFASGKQAVFSTSSQRSWKKSVRDLSFVGANPTIVSDVYAAAQTTYQRIFIGTSAPGAATAIMHVSDNYMSCFDTIEIIGDKTLTTGRVGWGFWAEPSNTAGGANVYRNITAGYVDEGLVIGQPFSSGAVAIGKVSKGNSMNCCQGHFANIGIHFMQNCHNIVADACWGEYCDVAPIRVDNSARNIEIVSPVLSMSAGTIGARGLVVIGNGTTDPGIDAASNISVRNGWFFCTDGLAGVCVYNAAKDVLVEGNSFHNGGGAAIGIEGGVGGEVTARNNNYFPGEASMEIGATRRFCTITGPIGSVIYSDKSPFALELDWTPDAVSGDLDCSSWRRPPKSIAFSTLGGSRTLTLPDLATAGGRLATCCVRKPYGANSVTVDAGSGKTIQGAQTAVLSAAYSSLQIVHAGNGANKWDVV